jgi:hypothetical protein
MAKKQGTKKKAAGRKAIPYAVIAKMVQAGSDALTIAKKIGRVNAGDDKTHTLRAIISGMRTRGWENEQGRLQKLTVKRVSGQKKKAVKTAAKKPAKKPATKPKPTASTQPDGKTVAAGGE